MVGPATREQPAGKRHRARDYSRRATRARTQWPRARVLERLARRAEVGEQRRAHALFAAQRRRQELRAAEKPDDGHSPARRRRLDCRRRGWAGFRRLARRARRHQRRDEPRRLSRAIQKRREHVRAGAAHQSRRLGCVRLLRFDGLCKCARRSVCAVPHGSFGNAAGHDAARFARPRQTIRGSFHASVVGRYVPDEQRQSGDRRQRNLGCVGKGWRHLHRQLVQCRPEESDCPRGGILQGRQTSARRRQPRRRDPVGVDGRHRLGTRRSIGLAGV